MKKLTAESIIKSYKALVAERGQVVGQRVFARESGVPQYYWNGGIWARWSDLQAAAGYEPNQPEAKIPDEVLLRRFAEVILETGRVPTQPDLIVRSKNDPTFPGRDSFNRWGNREALLAAVMNYCEEREDMAPVLRVLQEGSSARVERKLESQNVAGFVYLIRSGKHYKIGRSNAAGRRLRELSIQLPKRPDTVHVIETDDPEGIEQYWHRRFADRREGGEWFSLSAEDVRAFKRRRFQ